MPVKKRLRITLQSLQVLRVFLNGPNVDYCGAQITEVTALPSGTIYPILKQLKNHGFVKSYWEKGNPRRLGRPLKHYYKITAEGKEKAKRAFALISKLKEAT